MKILQRYFFAFLALMLPSLGFSMPVSVFTVPVTDKSVAFLGEFFGSVGGVLHGPGLLMGQLFGVLNAGVLSVAGIFVTYAILMGVINTAQDGEFMGRGMKSAWVTLRSTLGIGMLVPKFGGYCLAQVIVMWAVVQGVGFADHAWYKVVNYLNNEGGQLFATPSVTSDISSNLTMSQRVLASEVCMYKLQNIYNNEQSTQSGNARSYVSYEPIYDYNDKRVYFGGPQSQPGLYGVCGVYSWAAPGSVTDPTQQAIYEKYMLAGFEQVVTDLAPYADNIVNECNDKNNNNYCRQSGTTLQQDLVANVGNALAGAAMDYRSEVEPAVQDAINNGKRIIVQHMR